MVKFFKKLVPRTQVVVAGIAGKIQFQTLDGLVGYYKTDNTQIQASFAHFMANDRYGISEISEEEYMANYEQKKNLGLPKPSWKREELGSRSNDTASPIRILGVDAVRAATAAKTSDIPVSLEEGGFIPIASPSAPVPEAKPPVNTGTRKRNQSPAK